MTSPAYDLVVFWKQNDSGIYGRRSDLLVRELTRSDRVRSTTHFDAPLGVHALHRMGQADGVDHHRLVFEHTTAATATDLGARFCRRTFLYDDGPEAHRDAGLGERFGDFVAEVLVARGVGEAAPTVFLVYPTNPHLPGLIDRFRPTIVVADVVDDNRTWYPAGSPQHRALAGNYRSVLERSDVVLANCGGVAEAMAEFRVDVELVPNACEPLETPAPARTLRFAELAELRGPVIGYVGNLSSRIDIDLIAQVASARPDWTVVLIGSTHAGSDARRLGASPNVRMLGPRQYEDAKRYIRGFDVAIIPHIDDAMTRSMQPLKAYVYAALGVPVVSTPVANLPDLGPAITVAQGRDAFVEAIDRLVAGGRTVPSPDTVRALEANSWPVRAAQVLGLVDHALDARRRGLRIRRRVRCP